MKFSQAPAAVVMVRPKSFGFNNQTAETNAFQRNDQNAEQSNNLALAEFDRMVDVLRSNDINVIVVEDTSDTLKPDAIFPNNWISFHPEGTVVLYPMLAENRRLEREIPVIESVKSVFNAKKTIDLTHWEKQNKYLEGTGSIVFDYVNKLAYAARSPRTSEEVLKDLCNQIGFTPIVFDAVDENGQSIYHTNVLLCIGTKFSIVCLDAIKNEDDQEKILDSFARTEHKVIAISYEQMRLFAGNMIEVQSHSAEPFVIVSEKAFYALLPGQLDALSKYAEPIPVAIPTIEQQGGGSVRCMMAGVF
jgi:hypothetical protein